MIEALPHVLIIFAAFCGFILAFYLHSKKKTEGPMVCPMKGDCSSVIKSEYSSFLGIPVELLGMAYYAVIAVSYGVFLLLPDLSVPIVVFGVLVASTAAVMFSAYLTFIQIGFLKQICTWCLVSAGLCAAIFALALVGSEFSFIELLAQHKTLVLVFHLVGLALGAGGATVGDLFFFRFLKDLRISHREADTLRFMSQVIWVGLAILIISGIGLYLPNMEALNESSKFLVKMTVVGVVTINGAFLNLLVAPTLVHIAFGKHTHQPGELRHRRRIAFALGAVSFTSWYTALILGAFRSVPLSYLQLLGIYLVVMLGAVGGSQVLEYYLGQKEMPTPEGE